MAQQVKAFVMPEKLSSLSSIYGGRRQSHAHTKTLNTHTYMFTHTQKYHIHIYTHKDTTHTYMCSYVNTQK